ncbi:MAG: C39 family peptidase [Anaerolineales bacterium]|nr:C39 family peptidase [Anaerolineales bacterium]
MRKKPTKIKPLYIVLACLVLALIIYNLPPVHDRLGWRVEEFWTDVRFFFNPPDEALFVPTQQTGADAINTPALTTLEPTATHTPLPTDLATPTLTPTPLPLYVRLSGVVYVDQANRWNYCGPANLTMALNFWGWSGNRDDVAAVIKPGRNEPGDDFIERGKYDVNVMPYELVDFVNDETEFRALWRYGGTMELLRHLVANGYPVVVEKGHFDTDSTGAYTWMGHYQFVTGYDDADGTFLVQDTYHNGPNHLIAYEEFEQNWRAFNFLFYIVYPPEREVQLYALLGSWGDPTWANRQALDRAIQDTQTLTDTWALYFAWFNVGTGHNLFYEYADAASAYDQAFQIYATLGDDNTRRPYRMLWYQTGPYRAYYYSGRYQDVINLATITLDSVRYGPVLEESLYWRALAEYALGDFVNAYADIRRTVYLNSSFDPGWATMQEWGITP